MLTPQKLQVKFSSITLNLEEIADYINQLLEENAKLKQENEKLKNELKSLENKKE